MRRFVAIFVGFFALGLQAQQGLYFTPNLGQWQEPFVARTVFKGGAFFIRKDGFRIKMYHPDDLPNIHKSFHLRYMDTSFPVRGHVVDVSFLGASPNENISVLFEEEASWYENYFLGDDSTRWRPEVYPVKRVRLKNVYPGIDFIVYTEGESVEFDWVVQPGGTAEDIRMQFLGQDSFDLRNGDIRSKTTVGDFTVLRPKAFQNDRRISCDYLQENNSNIFSFYSPKKDWNKNKPLIIDPVLVFSTYSGSRGDNFGYTATYDTGGYLYAGGIIDIAQGAYPVTTGAFQTVYGGRGPAVAPVLLPCDASISKYKPDGSALVYATYLGGKSNEYPHSLGLDERNNLLVFGTTLSSNFPVKKNTAFDTSYAAAHDIFVVKLSADGSKMLAGTYLGGNKDDGINNGTLHYNYADDFRGDIICDDLGNIYVATCSRSSGFPTTPNAPQPTYLNGLDGVILSMDGQLSKLRWSTFVGDSLDDAAYSIKLDDSAHIIVGGGTSSPNFPILGNAYQKTYQGGRADGWVIKMTADSGKRSVSTFWGTDKYDQVYFVDFDIKNKIYVTGQTEGVFNRTAGTYGQNNTTQFIGRLQNNLDTLELVTTFGNRSGQPELSPCAFLVDKCYNIYFSGWGSSVGVGNAGTTQNLEITGNAFQKTTDNNDFYLIVLGKDAKSLLYATYFGGDSSEDHVDGGTSRFDKRGVIYQSVCSSCPNQPPGLNDFPTTSGAAFPINVSYRCSNASFKFDFNITYAVDADFNAFPRTVCHPDTVFFVQSATYGKTFFWDFGDGNTSNSINPFHVYAKTGNYRVKLTVIDSGSCNVVDSHTMNISVLESPAVQLKYTLNRCASAVNLQVDGSNMGTPQWNLGDGNTASGNKVNHNYVPGNYTIKVVVEHPSTGCKDSIMQGIVIHKDSLQEVFLANVFTPNNDDKNDCYRVIGLSQECDKAELRIFNRWGERIFYTEDLTQCWNGLVNNDGAELPEGTYFYQIIVKKGDKNKDRKVINGSINLIR